MLPVRPAPPVPIVIETEDGTSAYLISRQAYPPPPPPPVTPLNDTFTDSAVALDSHTSDSSHTWFGVATSVGGMALTGSGTVYGQEPPLAQTIYASSFTPSSADYTVSVTYKVFNFAGDFGAFGRFSGTTPTTFSGYGFRFSAGGGGIQLYKAIAGSYTQLGSTVTATPVDGDVLSLTMASNVLTVKKNGSTVLTVTDSSSPILTAGGVAIWASDGGGGTTAGLHATQIQTS